MATTVEVGGYFGLKLPDYGNPKPAAVGLQSARVAVRSAIEAAGVSVVWLPSYICDSMVSAVEDAGAEPRFYLLTDRWPLTVWFLAMHLLTQAKNNVSALELMRHLGVGYSAAWRIKHKLLHTGRVEIDDAYLGGERPGKRSRGGSPNKVPFVIGVPTVGDNRAHQVAIQCTPFTKDAISQWASTTLHANTQAWSDGLPAFGALAEEVAEHHPIIAGSGRAAAEHAEFRCLNIVLGNLKTAITGTYHAFNFVKYAPRHLAEFQYRFNRRYNLRTILPQLTRAAAITSPCPESQLRLAEFAN